MKTGLESLDTGAPKITYSGNEGPKSPQQMQMAMADPLLEDEYEKYVFEMEEQGLEPMSFEEFEREARSGMADGGITRIEFRRGGMKPVEQAGVMNYMPSEMVTVPKIAKSSPDTPTAKLAYITPEEQDILIDLNLYGSLDGKPNRGPGGIPSLEGDFGSPTGQAYGSDAGSYSEAGTGRDVSTDSQGRTVIGGDINQGVDVREARSAKAEAIREQIEREKNEAIKAAQDLQAKKVMDRRKKMGAKLIRERIPGTQEYLDAEKDDTAAELDLFINDPYREDGTKRSFLPTPMGIGLNLLEKPFQAGAKKTREFFSGPTTDIFGRKQKGVLAAGKFNYKGEPLTEERFAKMSLTEKNQAYKDYMGQRLGNSIDAYGNPLNTRDDGPITPLPNIGPVPISPITKPITPVVPNVPTPFTPAKNFNQYDTDQANKAYMLSLGVDPRMFAADGGRMNYAGGGIADLRQGYFLGKLVKKVTRGIKKVAKSPLGKAALAYGLYQFGPQLLAKEGFGFKGGFRDLISKGIFKEGSNISPFRAITALSSLPLLMGQKEEENKGEVYRGEGLDIRGIRQAVAAGNLNPVDYPFMPQEYYMANGGIAGARTSALNELYGIDDEDEIKKLSKGGSAGLPPVTMTAEGQNMQSFPDDESTGMPQATPTMPNQMPMRPPMMDPRMQQLMMMQQRMNPMMARGMMQQPRIMAQEGGMMDMGGMEKDYRNEGGFVAIGGQERADDVPARLSKNEFVFTADAVRNAGGGDIDKGAEIMENMMENLEQGGKVSESSQGLSGAREMFATSQRLGEVL
jgi:hypothetical protein